MTLISLLAEYWKMTVGWCRHHKQLMAAAVGAFVGVYVASRKSADVAVEKVQADESAAATSLSIKEVAIEQGAAAAHQVVAEQYKETLAKLDRDEQMEAAKLSADPVALAKFLVNKS